MHHDKPPIPITKDEMKQAVKEGLREWLDEKFQQFGKWSLGALAALALAALIYAILAAQGWKPPS